ncbi:hypothetical protein CBL_09634 [Carabus blaptoides fortunei]
MKKKRLKQQWSGLGRLRGCSSIPPPRESSGGGVCRSSGRRVPLEETNALQNAKVAPCYTVMSNTRELTSPSRSAQGGCSHDGCQGSVGPDSPIYPTGIPREPQPP